ncbi:hypothetical protein ACOME3_006442 [Neoechinorhynchus agilis]
MHRSKKGLNSSDDEMKTAEKDDQPVAKKKRVPLSLDEMVERRKRLEEEESKPKFLSKAEREAEALKRRQEEADKQRRKIEEARASHLRYLNEARHDGDARDLSRGKRDGKRTTLEDLKTNEDKGRESAAIRERYLGANALKSIRSRQFSI